jgi:hypothetical protein
MNIQVTASEFQQSFGEVSAKAAREPVTITTMEGLILSLWQPRNGNA